MKDKQIHLLKGDWTNFDEGITNLLEKYQRGGVPLYLLFPRDNTLNAQVLPQILSPSTLKEAINKIQKP